MAQMDGAVTVFGRYAQKKKYWSSGEYLSGPRMTTGFGPFELPTRGPTTRGGHSHMRHINGCDRGHNL